MLFTEFSGDSTWVPRFYLIKAALWAIVIAGLITALIIKVAAGPTCLDTCGAGLVKSAGPDICECQPVRQTTAVSSPS